MVRKYLFVDEAGNFDFSNKTGASRYFILTSIALDGCELGTALLDLRRRLAWEGLPLLAEFHATEETQAVRDEVFGLLTGHQFRIDATILEKRKAQPRLTMDETQFYKTAWFLHTKYVLPRIASKGDEVLIVSATLGTRKKQHVMSEAVQEVVRQVAEGIDTRTAFWSAASEPCLQIADFCCWAIQRKWERNDLRSHALIADKICSEFDVFRLSTKAYY